MQIVFPCYQLPAKVYQGTDDGQALGFEETFLRRAYVSCAGSDAVRAINRLVAGFPVTQSNDRWFDRSGDIKWRSAYH